MSIFKLIFFLNFLFYLQAIQVVFFCDDNLYEIYVIESTGTRQIAHGNNAEGVGSFAYRFLNLNADPGDYIKFRCYNSGAGLTYGGGCFLMNGECICYMFKNSNNLPYSGSISYPAALFPTQTCSMPLQSLQQTDVVTDYYYEGNIPLQASRINCQNKELTVPCGQNQKLKILDYVSADFTLKNLLVSITDNYEFFTKDGQILDKNNKFNVASDLIFS